MLYIYYLVDDMSISGQCANYTLALPFLLTNMWKVMAVFGKIAVWQKDVLEKDCCVEISEFIAESVHKLKFCLRQA